MMKHLNKTLSAFTGRFVWQEIHNYPPPEPEQPPLLLDPLTQILGTEGNEGRQAKPETKEKPPSSVREYLNAMYNFDAPTLDNFKQQNIDIKGTMVMLDNALYDENKVKKADEVAYKIKAIVKLIYKEMTVYKNMSEVELNEFADNKAHHYNKRQALGSVDRNIKKVNLIMDIVDMYN